MNQRHRFIAAAASLLVPILVRGATVLHDKPIHQETQLEYWHVQNVTDDLQLLRLDNLQHLLQHRVLKSKSGKGASHRTRTSSKTSKPDKSTKKHSKRHGKGGRRSKSSKDSRSSKRTKGVRSRKRKKRNRKGGVGRSPTAAPGESTSAPSARTADTAAPVAGPTEVPTGRPSPRPVTPAPTACDLGAEEDCSADGTCNPNCSTLGPDPDCEDAPADTTTPRCTTFSDFESGDEGWIVTGDSNPVDPNYCNPGGNPGGHIIADDAFVSGIWYFQAPVKFHGDFEASYGRTLSWDLKVSLNDDPLPGVDIVISNSQGDTISFTGVDQPGLDWTSYSVALDDSSGWRLGDNSSGPLASEADIRNVLSDIALLELRGDFQRMTDTGFLDNVRLESSNCLQSRQKVSE